MKKTILAISISSVLLLAACGDKTEMAPTDPNTETPPTVVTNGDYVNPALSIGNTNTNNSNQTTNAGGGPFFKVESAYGPGFNTEATVDSNAGKDLNSLNLTPEQLALLEQMEKLEGEQNQEQQQTTQKTGNNGLNTGLTDQVLSTYENSNIVNGTTNNLNSGSNSLAQQMNQNQNAPQPNSGSLTQTTQQLLQQKLNELSGSNGNYQVGAGYEEEVTQEFPQSTLNHQVVNEVQAPLAIKNWVSEQKKKAGIIGKEDGNYYYILFSAGPKSESGFSVDLLGAYVGVEGAPAEMHFEVRQNKTGRIAMTTYPILIVRVLKSDVPNDLQFYGNINEVAQ